MDSHIHGNLIKVNIIFQMMGQKAWGTPGEVQSKQTKENSPLLHT